MKFTELEIKLKKENEDLRAALARVQAQGQDFTELAARIRRGAEVMGSSYGCYGAPIDSQVVMWAKELEKLATALAGDIKK